jgi:hypothetical protein
VVEHRNADDGCGFRDHAREGDVLVARSRVTARVVVDEHESRSRLAERHAQHVARRHVQAVDAARGDAPRGTHAVVAVEDQEP